MQKLTGDTIQLISSSQVITSVHSVVKELVENALDAKTSNVDVRLENYGLDLIQVRDNGTGMKRSDVPLMAAPHYTSKLRSFQDLSSLTSYGFRGEALSSIANTAQLCITTATKEDEIATTYTIGHNGQVIDKKPSSLGVGTTIAVSDIFKNFPVRKKSYKNTKRCSEELRKIEQLLLAFGLAFPGVRFSLKHNKIKIWDKEQASDHKSNVSLIFGPVLSHNLMPVNYQCFSPMVKLQLYVPKPSADLSLVTRSRPDRMIILVNGRPVDIKAISKVVRVAFLEAFPSQTSHYPVAVVMISVLPEDVDVNLEPNKTKVLLHNIDFIISTLSSLLTQAYGPCRVPVPERDSPKKSTKQQQSGRKVDGRPFEKINNKDSSIQDGGIDVPQQHRDTSPVANTIADQLLGNPVNATATVNENDKAISKPTLSITLSQEDHTPIPPTEPDVHLGPDYRYSLLDISELERDFSSSSEDEGAVVERDNTESCDGATGSAGDRVIKNKQTSLLSWSRGSAITDSNNTLIEPVKIVTTSTSKEGDPTTSFKFYSWKDNPVLLHSRPVKRAAGSISEGERPAKKPKDHSTSSLDRFLTRQEHPVVTRSSQNIPSLDARFEVEKITRRNELLWKQELPVSSENRVVGSCHCRQGDDVWLVLLKRNTLAAFNIHNTLSETSEVTRAQVEQCLNKTLLKDTSSVDSQDCFQKLRLSSGEAAMVMGGLISCIKRRKQKEIHSNSVDEYNHGFTERELDNPAYENFHDELSNSVT